MMWHGPMAKRRPDCHIRRFSVMLTPEVFRGLPNINDPWPGGEHAKLAGVTIEPVAWQTTMTFRGSKQ